MRTTFLLLVLSISLLGYSQVTKTINVETAGSLSTLLTEDEKNTVTDLTVTGTINAWDIKCIRDQIANITNLDLSNANIAAFEGTATSSVTTSFPANEMPRSSFYRSGSSVAVTPLKMIILPNSLTSIGDYAFYLCTNMTSIYIGNSISNIGEYAFEGCFGLTSVTMGNSVTTIKKEAFGFCYALNNLTLSESITTLGDQAFYECSMQKVSVPGSLSYLSNAFCGNTDLKEITLPASITSFSKSAFSYCSSLNTIYSLNTTPPVCDYIALSGGTSVTSVYVPASAVSAYKNAPIWGTNFYSKIKAIQTSESIELRNEDIRIYSLNSTIIIENTSKGEMLKVFTLTGQLLKTVESTGQKVIIPVLRNNMYIVKTATKSFKVFIQE